MLKRFQEKAIVLLKVGDPTFFMFPQAKGKNQG